MKLDLAEMIWDLASDSVDNVWAKPPNVEMIGDLESSFWWRDLVVPAGFLC